MAKIQDIDIPHLEFGEAAAPGTPASAVVRIYAKSDGLMYSKDDAGAETLMSGGLGSGGGMATDTLWDATGDLAVGSGANTGARLAVGSTDRLLKVVGGTAAWGLPHAFGCQISGSSTALSSGAYVSLSYGAADTYDPDGYHDPSGSPTIITVPSGLGGQYLLNVQCTWPNTTTADTQKRIAYRVNGGGEVILYRVSVAQETSGLVGFHSASIGIALAAGDTLEVRQWVTNANAQTTTEYRASLYLVGVA